MSNITFKLCKGLWEYGLRNKNNLDPIGRHIQLSLQADSLEVIIPIPPEYEDDKNIEVFAKRIR